VLFGYLVIYLPLSNETVEAAAQLELAQKRLALARDIERLRTQHNSFKKRLPQKTDANEWVKYMLDGIRTYPLKLVALDPRPTQEIGPYKAVVLRIELEGDFQDLHAFLCWLEGNDRLFRIEGIALAPHRQSKGVLSMQLTVLGVMG
jgi:Tfp pilus assembly protein PilO